MSVSLFVVCMLCWQIWRRFSVLRIGSVHQSAQREGTVKCSVRYRPLYHSCICSGLQESLLTVTRAWLFSTLSIQTKGKCFLREKKYRSVMFPFPYEICTNSIAKLCVQPYRLTVVQSLRVSASSVLYTYTISRVPHTGNYVVKWIEIRLLCNQSMKKIIIFVSFITTQEYGCLILDTPQR